MLVRKLLYWSNFTVIRWQLILSIAVFAIVGYWAKKNYETTEPDTWMLVGKTFFPIVKYTFLSLFLFSLLTGLVAWVYFLVRVKAGAITVQVKIGQDEHAEAGLVPLTISIHKALRPLLGSVRARIVFPDHKISEMVLLDEGIFENRSLLRKGIRGEGKTLLHDRGIYDVREVDVFFSDMFRLVSLPVTFQFNKQLHTLPREMEEHSILSQPNTAEEQTQRIEIPKRVEGEYLNYKDFESGDDVRRIVWKIYARSGELVVRIPETMDPYASHLYFYASFYHGMKDVPGEYFETELLNVYKDNVRNIFEALKKNGFEMRFPHDQETPKIPGISEKHNEIYHIAVASWQQYQRPAEFVNARKAAFVCISSLTPVQEVYRLFSNLPLNVPVVAVKMSEAIHSPLHQLKLKNLFFVKEEEPEDKLVTPWLISPLRSKLLQNEKELGNLFQRRGNAFLISANPS